ncbi:hypothetical protein EGJ57_23580 [Brucella anthropi]|uniref:hypothetical protein n=1 Tax=Brucella anthropi TaxID=529 RepID=UPI000F66593E|nr:hypothetical protein [Brucella anthropi]RRY15875.1 hypothetical protein EGJ57_23580 [Brucella anthropi]
MKLKMDFVSNSSSTSFIYISDRQFTRDSFFEAIGANDEGPIGELFSSMFDELNNAISRGDRITSVEGANSTRDFDLTPEVLARIEKAITDGTPVIRGGLSSDGALAESLLCTTIFEIDTDAIFINAYPSYW